MIFNKQHKIDKFAAFYNWHFGAAAKVSLVFIIKHDLCNLCTRFSGQTNISVADSFVCKPELLPSPLITGACGTELSSLVRIPLYALPRTLTTIILQLLQSPSHFPYEN